MVNYFELTKNIYLHMIADEDVNMAVIGSIDEVDLGKQSMFPLSHIMVDSAKPLGGVMEFTVTLAVMDIVDVSNDNLDAGESVGRDNREDILNTTFAVMEGFDKSLDSGALYDLGWEMQGTATATPFEDEFENLLTGWRMSFTVQIPNRTQYCPTEIIIAAGLEEILDNILI